MEERGSYEILWVPKFFELFGQNFRIPPNIVEIYGATLLHNHQASESTSGSIFQNGFPHFSTMQLTTYPGLIKMKFNSRNCLQLTAHTLPTYY